MLAPQPARKIFRAEMEMYMVSFIQGRLYKFVFSDGHVAVLRFEGFGENMHQVWVDHKSGSKVYPLPAYKSVELI